MRLVAPLLACMVVLALGVVLVLPSLTATEPRGHMDASGCAPVLGELAAVLDAISHVSRD